MTTIRIQLIDSIVHGLMLSLLCMLSYVLITQLLAHVVSLSRADDLLGGMWAVIATIFVYRSHYRESTSAAASRIGATILSFVLCFIYLLFFPFKSWGMAVLIGIGAIVMSLLGRPRDIMITGITTAVVMVVAAISPDHAWRQPILRVADTLVGVAVGVFGAWIGSTLATGCSVRRRVISRDSLS